MQPHNRIDLVWLTAVAVACIALNKISLHLVGYHLSGYQLWLSAIPGGVAANYFAYVVQDILYKRKP